jgi:hypothetical protein
MKKVQKKESVRSLATLAAKDLSLIESRAEARLAVESCSGARG